MQGWAKATLLKKTHYGLKDFPMWAQVFANVWILFIFMFYTAPQLLWKQWSKRWGITGLLSLVSNTLTYIITKLCF